MDAYSRAALRAEEVLAVHISSALSGTVDNARIAAARIEAEYAGNTGREGGAGRRRPQWLRVVDSGTSSGALDSRCWRPPTPTMPPRRGT